MTPDMELGMVLRRIASATGVIQIQTAEQVRSTNHGATNGELATRTRALVARLEKVATQLEKAIA